MAAATLIGRMAGTDVDPVVLHRRVAEEKIMENGNRYLQSLHKEKRLRHHWNTELNEETGEHTCTVTVIIGSDWYLYVATAKGKKSSEKKAAAQAITELDLINNPPPVPVEVERKLGPSKNPIVELQARLQQAHAKQVVYVAVLLNAPPNPRSRCTGTLVYEGKEYVAVAEATSKDLAKQMVAEELLERVPLPPLVSRKERLKRRQGG